MSYSPKRAESSSQKSAPRAKTASRVKVETDAKTESSKQPSLSAAEKKKKKTLTIAIVAILGVVILVSLTFIFAPADGSFLGIRGAGVFSGGSKINGWEAEYAEADGTTNITPYYENGVLPTSSDRHDITLAENGGANASELLGRWKLDEGTTYMFDGKGRGILLTGADNFTFLYSAEKGKLGIDMDTIVGNDFEYDYTVSGDTLTMTRDNGATSFTLTKISDQ